MRSVLPLLVFGASCAGPVEVLTCDATLAAHMTLMPRVDVVTTGEARTWVSYAAAGEDEHQTTPASGAEHAHYLRGMPAETSVSWTAWLDDGDGETEACAGEITTGALPSDLPTISVTEADADVLDDGTLFLGAVWELFGDYPYLVVFDRAGVVRWYVEGPPQTMILDSQPARDGDGILYNTMDGNFEQDVAAISTVSLDGLPVREVTTPLGHHMFVQLPDGGLAYQGLDIRDWEDPENGESRTVVGDYIAEIQPDGAIDTLTSTWDWAEIPPPSDHVLYGIYGRFQDWTHGNALKYDEDADEYLVSLGNVGVVAQVDRATGLPTQLYGSAGFTVYGGAELENQHDPTLLDDGLIVFMTDGSIPTSGAVEYEIDRDAGTISEVWRHGFGQGDYAPMLGQVTPLAGGGRRINFGGGGTIEEIDVVGDTVWQVEMARGNAFAQVSELPDFWPAD